MPLYEYACDSCRVIYQAWHGMNDPKPERCPRCTGGLRRVYSAPRVSNGYTSPSQAKYARISESEEIAREAELQKVYQTLWLPDQVKHSPWDEH
ncbi:MAG TPA: zinc ribbon domain-containing protein [Burkholderiales bacterium]|jgi:putative FmdB family regulatory protein|nr:zinc ribbon domain-containing protein [Burkholderiales bacterium]